MFSLSVTIVILNIMKSNATARIGARISADLRVALFEKYQKLPLEFINDRRPGELLNRIINDTVFQLNIDSQPGRPQHLKDFRKQRKPGK